ncbi:MAG: hypothetical protein ABR968_02595 [Bacteroidales bacterium]|jgi:hypothetical protein
MENRIAKIISYIFHPVFMPAYSLLLLFNLKSFFNFELEFKSKLILLGFVLITTVVFPLLIVLLMKRQGFIQSYQMETRQERRFPYLITAIFYFLAYNMFRQMHLPDMYIFSMMGAAALLVIVIIVNLWWKISTHMVGMGGVFGLITGLSLKLGIDMTFIIAAIMLVSGIVGYARLRSGSHKPAEIYTGFLTGAVVMFAIFNYFL